MPPPSSPPPPGGPAEGDEPDTLVGVVLAGGASRRMGTDKALLVGPDGRTMLEQAIERLRAAGAGAVVVASGPTARYDVPDGVAQVPDPPGHVGDGPLAGLAAAFGHAGGGIALVLAVDLPDADASLLRHLARIVAAPDGPAAAVPVDPSGRAQPLHAAYDAGRALPVLEAALAEGDRRVLPAVVDRLGARLVEPPPGTHASWHRNVNRPDDAWRTPPPVG